MKHLAFTVEKTKEVKKMKKILAILVAVMFIASQGVCLADDPLLPEEGYEMAPSGELNDGNNYGGAPDPMATCTESGGVGIGFEGETNTQCGSSPDNIPELPELPWEEEEVPDEDGDGYPIGIDPDDTDPGIIPDLPDLFPPDNDGDGYPADIDLDDNDPNVGPEEPEYEPPYEPPPDDIYDDPDIILIPLWPCIDTDGDGIPDHMDPHPDIPGDPV